MATMASVLKKVAPPGQEVVVSNGRSREAVRDGRLFETVARAFALSKKAAAIEEQLKKARAFIAERAWELCGRDGAVELRCGDISCRVRARHEAAISEEKVKDARRILGRRFRELVNVKTRYLASRRLLEEAASRKDLEDLITLRQLSPQFTWRVTEAGELPLSGNEEGQAD